MIFDDFRERLPRRRRLDRTSETNMHRVLPGRAGFIPMDPKMPVYDSFFKIESFDIIPQSYDRGRVELFGLFEDNDPTQAADGRSRTTTPTSRTSGNSRPPASGRSTNRDEAYKLGVNYVIYGMTHWRRASESGH